MSPHPQGPREHLSLHGPTGSGTHVLLGPSSDTACAGMGVGTRTCLPPRAEGRGAARGGLTPALTRGGGSAETWGLVGAVIWLKAPERRFCCNNKILSLSHVPKFVT